MIGNAQHLASPYQQHTQHSATGMVTTHAPVPLPPINEHTIVPQNQIPAEMGVHVDSSTMMRKLNHQQFDFPILGDTSISIPRDLQSTQSSVPDIAKALHSTTPMQISMAQNHNTAIIHPLNRRFVQTEDPLNQRGRGFYQEAGAYGSDPRQNISIGHIFGEAPSSLTVHPSETKASDMVGNDSFGELAVPADNMQSLGAQALEQGLHAA